MDYAHVERTTIDATRGHVLHLERSTISNFQADQLVRNIWREKLIQRAPVKNNAHLKIMMEGWSSRSLLFPLVSLPQCLLIGIRPLCPQCTPLQWVLGVNFGGDRVRGRSICVLYGPFLMKWRCFNKHDMTRFWGEKGKELVCPNIGQEGASDWH